MIKEFRDFIMRGNVLELAVAVIIGGAFGKIVTSLVNDIIMPPIGVAMGGVDFSDLAYTIQEAVMNDAGEVVTPAVSLNWGSFVQTIIDFLIIAFVIFMIVRSYNKLTEKAKEEEAAAPPSPSAEETLLTEIRDILKNQQ
ncbi:MAG: large-conductance mechanosensitive channel protein MscL [Bacteroidota bacterium]